MPTFKKAGSAWYEVVNQSERASCPVACASMITKMVTGKHISEDFLKQQSSSHRGGGNYSTAGASKEHVLELLERFKVPCTAHAAGTASNVLGFLTSASNKKPVILGLGWGVGGKHMIVSPGLNKNQTHWVALDPGDGGTHGTASEQDVTKLLTYNHPLGISGTIDLVIVT